MPPQELWQLRCSAPELFERYLVPAVTAPWAVHACPPDQGSPVRGHGTLPASHAWPRHRSVMGARVQERRGAEEDGRRGRTLAVPMAAVGRFVRSCQVSNLCRISCR